MTTTAPLKPPRRTGDAANDLLALFDWAGDLWTAMVREGTLFAFTPLAIVPLTIAGDERTASYAFAKARPNTNYTVIVQPRSVVDSGDLFGAAAFVVRSIERRTTGFTVTFACTPGAGNSITFDAFLFST